MGTNYYFKPKKFKRDKIRNLREEYTSKLEKLLKDYIESIDELFRIVDARYKDKNNKAHDDAYKDKQGYEWVSQNFS